MNITCPQCGQQIAVSVAAPRYEIQVECPKCHRYIVVEVGPMPVGPTETTGAR